MTLDSVDKRLLYELDQNARQGISAVAKKLRLNRNVALYRFNRLKKQAIVKYAFAEINSVGLGYYSFRVFLKLGNFTKSQEQDLSTYLLKQKNLIWFSRVLGKWDLDIVYATKDIHKFAEFKSELLLAFNSIIEDFEIALLLDIYCYSKDYLVNRERKNTLVKHFGKVNYAADKKDLELLVLLTKDAMMPVLELAKRTDLSVNTVKKKMKTMEREGIILSYRLFLDTAKLGYHYYKLHMRLRNYNKQDLAAFRSFLETKSYMIYTDHHLDADDFQIELQLESEPEYLAFLDELYASFGRIIKEHFVIKFYEEKLFRYLPEE